MQNILIRDLCKSYKEKAILCDVNLDIHAGDFLTLLGSSGCGKTTLLNILGGFSNFDSGYIIVDSANAADLLDLRIETSKEAHTKDNLSTINDDLHAFSKNDNSQALAKRIDKDDQSCKIYTNTLDISANRVKVFQNYVLLPWKSALNQVIFALQSKFRHMKNKDLKERALYYLELVGLQGHIHKFPHELSGGQQSRVNIARALSVAPEVLLMDEPFGALDSFTRENLQRELKTITNTLKTTCVFVTHDVDEALVLGNRVIVMNATIKNISLRLDIHNAYEKQDPYFQHLKGEIYENLKYPRSKSDYVI